MQAAAKEHELNAKKLGTEAGNKIAAWYLGKTRAYSIVLFRLQQYDKKR